MAITNPYYKDWVENEKKEWEEKFGDDFIEVEGGLYSLNYKKTSYWNETLFLDAIPFFTANPTPYLYTYCYCSYGRVTSFFEFVHANKCFRLAIGETSDMLKCSITIKKNEEKHYYDLDYTEINENELLSLYEILNNLANFFLNLPRYRLKIITGELLVVRSEIDKLPLIVKHLKKG